MDNELAMPCYTLYTIGLCTNSYLQIYYLCKKVAFQGLWFCGKIDCWLKLQSIISVLSYVFNFGQSKDKKENFKSPYIFLTRNAGCSKSFLIKTTYLTFSKIFTNNNVAKEKVFTFCNKWCSSPNMGGST